MGVTGIRCPICKDAIWSRHRHDFRRCSCGYCAVDGGREYLRYDWGIMSDKPDDRSITLEEWSDIYEANAYFGRPKLVEIEVPDVKLTSSDSNSYLQRSFFRTYEQIVARTRRSGGSDKG